MTKQELDYAHSKLNMEYTKKSNDINCRKDDVSREKLNRLLAIRMETAAKKDEIRTNIEMLRNERLKYERDTSLYNEISEKIRIQENRIARLKEQADIEAAQVHGDAYATRLQLDYEARQLSEWLEAEKLRINEAFLQEHCNEELLG